ncbi:MAG: metal ABC transporter permease, partial [Erysipelothrix sp.]|nr:metal ABC transporter permease [Erysipelothrix sp.]
ITVSLASRIIGALVVSSLMVIPIAAAMRITKSYKMTFIISMIFSLLSLYTGLTLAYYMNLAPGGVIVLNSLAYLGLSFLIKNNG